MEPDATYEREANSGRSGWWQLPFVAVLVLLALVLGSYRYVASSRARQRADSYFDTTQRLELAAPIYARAGERWTFKVASLYGPGEGSEAWEVLSVGSSKVQSRVTSANGDPPRLESWSFVVPVRSERLVGCSRDVIQVGARSFTCDVAQVVVGGGVDWVRVWIAIDPLTQRPTFPGVLRLEREELRGRRMIEWDLVNIAPIASGP